MPKLVDHHARRLQLLDAVLRITRRDGWDAISLRHVAAEAGVSMGMVQHYFTTKDEMLRFAVEMMAEDTKQRMRQRVAELPQPVSPRLLVQTMLTEMIPDADRRANEALGADIWVIRFLLAPKPESPLHSGYDQVKGAVADQITLVRPGRADAERDADALIALIDGLIYNIVTGHQDARTAVAIVRAQLDYVFGPD
ncbi:MAG TPA: TetR/AcrR family transcriptional regulator [Pseudonocardiaceae bacterium]|nr:TetR/AcrR family transcriptional regulator [Pseudonocardiaceae bacterium]